MTVNYNNPLSKNGVRAVPGTEKSNTVKTIRRGSQGRLEGPTTAATPIKPTKV